MFFFIFFCTENFRGLDNEYDYGSDDNIEYSTIVTTESSVKTVTAKKEEKIPEIDSCCGHNAFTATPFDSELKTCCEDAVVKPWGAEGNDPCVDEFEIDEEF